jgi:hypothetical protein
MIRGGSHIPRPVLAAPLAVQTPAVSLGRAAWLYLALVNAANSKGLAVRSRHRLAKDLSVSEAKIDEWVKRLVAVKLVRVLSPAPFLAIALPSWPGAIDHQAGNPLGNVGKRASSHREVPVSSSKQAGRAEAAAAANKSSSGRGRTSKAGDGSPREGVPTDEEIREALNAPDLDVKALLAGVPKHAIRKALDRVRETPSSRIRKSKAALFRYLLAKFSEEIQLDEL